MTKQDLIKAWKNPKLRTADMVHPSGDALVEVGMEELRMAHGGGTPVVVTATIVISGVVVSGLTCRPGPVS